MPDTKTAASAAPTQSFLQRMFGSSQMSPETQQGIDIARKENPNMAPVEPYGFFSRLMQPKAQGYVVPGGNTIRVNPNQLQGQSPQEVADMLTHEQTHIQQNKDSPYGPTMQLLRSMLMPQNLPYGQRPDEMEAFQNEKNRAYSMGRTPTAWPSFTNPGEYNVPQGDINLPAARPSMGPSNPQQMMRPVTMK